MNLHNRKVCVCQFVFFLLHYILNYVRLEIFTMAIFVIQDGDQIGPTMSVVDGTKLHMKLYITKRMCANCRDVANIF